MHMLLRPACGVALVGLLVIGICALRPEVFVDLGLDWWNVPRCQWQYEADVERGEKLSQRDQFALERLRAKNAIARDLIAGRLSLAEASARFGELPHPPQRMRERLRQYHDGASDEEVMARHVIDWACLLVENEPARAEALRRRLQAELQWQ